MSSAMVKLPPELDGLLLSQLEDCIAQANLGIEDTWLVRRYLISHVPQADLAAELGWTRRTVYMHITKSIAKIKATAQNLPTIYT